MFRLTTLTILASGLLLFAHCHPAISAPSNPALIVRTTKSGVGYVDYQSNENGINALIGTWDSPYGVGLNGPPEPGKESEGLSTLIIEIDVNDGALLNFAYKYKTWDAGRWDWLDITIESPNDSDKIVNHLGRPGNDYGTYFESARITRSISLQQWRNKRITLKISVRHDGWGDQTQAEIIGLALRTCSVPPLTPLTDPDAIRFEQGDNVNIDRLQPNMRTALDCVQSAVTDAGGQLNVHSAYRPAAYQEHLREVWDKWQLLKDKREPECADLREEVRQEFIKHELLLTQQPAGARGNHITGRAVDMTSTLGMNTLVPIAEQCGLYRPIPGRDPVHFQFR